MKSKLQTALEDGKPVKGIVGYVETDIKVNDEHWSDGVPLLIKAKCLRVEAKSGSCEVKVIATPISGRGEFDVKTCRWFDTVKQFELKMEEEQKVKQAEEVLRSIFNTGLVSRAKTIFMEKAAEFNLLELTYEELNCTDNNFKTAVKNLSLRELRELASNLMIFHFKIEDGTNLDVPRY